MNQTNRCRQLRLPFNLNETREERVERLLGGKLREKVKRASDRRFDYSEATRIATRPRVSKDARRTALRTDSRYP